MWSPQVCVAPAAHCTNFWSLQRDHVCFCSYLVQEQVPRFGIQGVHCAHFIHPLHDLSWFWESLQPSPYSNAGSEAPGERFWRALLPLTWRASPTVPTRTRWPEDLGRDRGRPEGADSVASVCKEGDRKLCGPAAQPPRRGSPHLRVAEAEVVTESVGALLDLLEKSVPKGGPRRVPRSTMACSGTRSSASSGRSPDVPA